MHLGLAVQRLREQARRADSAGFNQRHAGLVTRRLESKHYHVDTV
jgi:hypothetical protein